MLLNFRLANVLSFRDEQQLSLIATEMHDGPAWETTIREASRPVAVLPVVAIFGANASGKSNALGALSWMREAVTSSVTWINHPDRTRRVPFALDPVHGGRPSFYEVDLELGGIRHTYGFELGDERIHAEWLHAYPKGRRQVWFERDGDGIRFPGDGLRGDKQDLVRKTRVDALFLSVAAEWNHEQLLPVFSWFRDNLRLVGPNRGMRDRHLFTAQRVLRDGRFRDRAARLLAVADLGIAGFDPQALEAGEVRLLHRTGDGTTQLRYEAESLGTQSWFAMLGPLLEAFDHGTTLLVDELDASLHPAISAEVIRMFSDKTANPRRAQLIFTTHDAVLLNSQPLGEERVLGRDQIWLTEKDASGASELYPLTSFHPPPRREDNLLRKYLLGRWGGMPRISGGEFGREMGAVEELGGASVMARSP